MRQSDFLWSATPMNERFGLMNVIVRAPYMGHDDGLAFKVLSRKYIRLSERFIIIVTESVHSNVSHRLLGNSFILQLLRFLTTYLAAIGGKKYNSFRIDLGSHLIECQSILYAISFYRLPENCMTHLKQSYKRKGRELIQCSSVNPSRTSKV